MSRGTRSPRLLPHLLIRNCTGIRSSIYRRTDV
jgi:hypothetical protein